MTQMTLMDRELIREIARETLAEVRAETIDQRDDSNMISTYMKHFTWNRFLLSLVVITSIVGIMMFCQTT